MSSSDEVVSAGRCRRKRRQVPDSSAESDSEDGLPQARSSKRRRRVVSPLLASSSDESPPVTRRLPARRAARRPVVESDGSTEDPTPSPPPQISRRRTAEGYELDGFVESEEEPPVSRRHPRPRHPRRAPQAAEERDDNQTLAPRPSPRRRRASTVRKSRTGHKLTAHGYDANDGFVVDEDEEEEEEGDDEVVPTSGESEYDIAGESEGVEDDEHEDEFHLFCSICEQLKPRDDFSVVQQRDDNARQRFCLTHTAGDQRNWVRRLQSQARHNLLTDLLDSAPEPADEPEEDYTPDRRRGPGQGSRRAAFLAAAGGTPTAKTSPHSRLGPSPAGDARRELHPFMPAVEDTAGNASEQRLARMLARLDDAQHDSGTSDAPSEDEEENALRRQRARGAEDEGAEEECEVVEARGVPPPPGDFTDSETLSEEDNGQAQRSLRSRAARKSKRRRVAIDSSDGD